MRHSSCFRIVLSQLNVLAKPLERQMTNAPLTASSSPSTISSDGIFFSFGCHGKRNPSFSSSSSSIPLALLIIGPIIPLSIFVAYFT
jgi:hypothetical protein